MGVLARPAWAGRPALHQQTDPRRRDRCAQLFATCDSRVLPSKTLRKREETGVQQV